MLLARELTERVIGLAIEVHRLTGPGTLESVYEGCLCVDRQVIIKIKAVVNLLPAHDAQVLTYLRMSGLRLGLLFNSHARLLKDGLRRLVV